jgi:hypothetical protein
MKWLLCFLCVFVPFLSGATEWPYIGGSVEASGSVYKLKLSTSPNLGSAAAVTNLNFFNGFGTNNSLSSTTALVLTVSSSGFNDAGAAITVSRTVYGTKILRLPYGLQNTNDVIAESTTNVNVRIWLSDFIYAGETVTATAISGAVASTNLSAFTNSAAFASKSVTNNSTLQYSNAPVLGNWLSVDSDIAPSSIKLLSFVAYHRDGQSGRPVRAVRFWSSDQHGNFVTQIVTQPIMVRGPATGLAVSKYQIAMDYSSLSNLDVITNNVIAYPWIGDVNTCLITADGKNLQPTPLYSPLRVQNNRNSLYGQAFAVVLTSGGNDATGVVTSNWNVSTPPAPFATMARAANACQLSNKIWFTRQDVGGSTIWCSNGTHNVFGASSSYGTNSTTYITVAGYPGVNRDGVQLTNTSGDSQIGQKIHLTNLTFAIRTTIGLDLVERVWLDNCVLDASGAAAIYECTNVVLTSCVVSNMPQGLASYSASSVNTTFGLVMDCVIYTLGASSQPYTFVGNYRAGTNDVPGAIFRDETSGQVTPVQENLVFAHNYIKSRASSAAILQLALNTNVMRGRAVVQNIIEQIATDQVQGFFIAADSSTCQVTNVIVWQNNVVGCRVNMFYNDSGSSPMYRILCSYKNNVVDDFNCKTDTFFSSPNGARIGNWSCINGVGFSGDIDGCITNVGASGFGNEQNGLNSYGYLYFSSIVNPTNYLGYTRNAAGTSGTGVGDGNYRLLTPSILFGATASPAFQTDWVMPFDMEGTPRGAIDPPGAYSAGNAKKGAMF